MADAWRPATELERRMQAALRAGDQEGYFRLLAEAELVIPVPPDLLDDVLANETQPTWPTQEDDGRTHVLAFTSAAAMRASIGPAYQHFMKLKFSDAAETWPDTRWWLAVDAGLPIEARLPSWFIKQVADGDSRPPQAGLPAPTHVTQAPQLEPEQQPTGRQAPPAEGPAAQGVAAQDVAAQDVAAQDVAAQDVAAQDVAAQDVAAQDVAAQDEAAQDEAAQGVAAQGVAAQGVAVQGAAGQGEPRAGSAPDAEFVPANDVERELLRASAQGDQDAFVKTLATAEMLLLIPDEMDFALRPGRPGFPWQTGELDGVTVIPVFTSVERMHEVIGEPERQGAEFIKVPFTTVVRYWPDRSWGLAVNSGTPVDAALPGEQLQGLSEWADQLTAQRKAENFEPQNDVEQRLFDAAVRRDTDAFFKVLLGAQVLVPADPETPWGIRPDDPEFPWQPVAVHGATSIQVFTSLKWMHESIGSSRFVMPGFLDIVSAWPDADWTLIINPGTPVDATLTGDRVRALAGARQTPPPTAPDPLQDTQDSQAPEAPQPQATAPQPIEPAAEAPAPEATGAPTEEQEHELEEEFEPGNRIDQELYEAAVSGDTDAFLRVLLAANVLVPIPTDAPLEVTPIQPEFRWEAAMRDASSVQVFTSLVRLREVLPASRFVYADFRELIGSWPRTDWAMLLNPGTRIGASLRGDQVQALSEWAVRVGLIRPRRQAPQTPASAPLQPVAPAADDEPLTEPVPTRDFAEAPSQAPAQSSYGEGAPAQQPVVMQKVLPHGHVGWYLEQGYDRVGGFIHPISDITELQTPAQLYEALGLLYEDSPFALTDEGVYVIRWPAYCGSLYRIPFGGQTEEELRSWGDAGWVLERAPFAGAGFAPGSAGSIREYKLDSARLPYGAEMYYLAQDRSEQFVAMYDPDRLAWLRPDAPAAEAQGPEAPGGRVTADGEQSPGRNEKAEATQ